MTRKILLVMNKYQCNVIDYTVELNCNGCKTIIFARQIEIPPNITFR